MATPIDTPGLAHTLIVSSARVRSRSADSTKTNRSVETLAPQIVQQTARASGQQPLDRAIAGLSDRLKSAESQLSQQLGAATSGAERQRLRDDLTKVRAALNGENPVQNLLDEQKNALRATDAGRARTFNDVGTGGVNRTNREPDVSIQSSAELPQDNHAQQLREIRQESIREDHRIRQNQLDDAADKLTRERRAANRDAAIEQRDRREGHARQLEAERDRQEVRAAYIETRAQQAARAYQAQQQRDAAARVFDATA